MNEEASFCEFMELAPQDSIEVEVAGGATALIVYGSAAFGGEVVRLDRYALRALIEMLQRAEEKLSE